MIKKVNLHILFAFLKPSFVSIIDIILAFRSVTHSASGMTIKQLISLTQKIIVTVIIAKIKKNKQLNELASKEAVQTIFLSRTKCLSVNHK